MKLTGIVLGGVADEQARLREQQAEQQKIAVQNRLADVAQQNADTQSGVLQLDTNKLAFSQRQQMQQLALTRINATLQQAAEIKKNLPSPQDVPKVAGTISNLLQQAQQIGQLAGIDPGFIAQQFSAALMGVPTISEAAQARGQYAGAEEAARTANSKPTVGYHVDSNGHQIVTLTSANGVIKSVDVGAAAKEFDLHSFQADLALRASGQQARNPDVQKLSPSDANTVLGHLASQNPLQQLISGALNGGTPTVPATDSVSSLTARVLGGGKITPTEWGALSPAQQAQITSGVQAGQQQTPAPPAALAPLGGGPAPASPQAQ